jgi:hypothetical protein
VTRRRRLLAATACGLAALTALSACGAVHENTRPLCRYSNPTVLMAQSVPGASLIPCVRSLPAGWHFDGLTATSRQSRFWLDSDTAGRRALEVVLERRCPEGRARAVKSDEAHTKLSERIDRVRPTYVAEWFYRFEGGCATYRLALSAGAVPSALRAVRAGVSFISRRAVADVYTARAGRPLDAPSRSG